MTDRGVPPMGPSSVIGFDAASAALTDALERHAEQVRAHTTHGADPAPTAIELARALLDFSLAEQELTGAAAVWPADPDPETDDPEIDDLGIDEDADGDGDEVTVVLRMDFALTDPAALLAAGDRAAADQGRPDDDSGDPIADAVFAIAHRHGWDSLAADEVPGLDATQVTAQVVTPTPDQEPRPS